MKAESTISDICYFQNILWMLQKRLWLKIWNFFWHVLRGKSTILNVCYFLEGQDQIITHNIEKLYVWVYPILMPHTRLREHVVVPETVQCLISAHNGKLWGLSLEDLWKVTKVSRRCCWGRWNWTYSCESSSWHNEV